MTADVPYVKSSNFVTENHGYKDTFILQKTSKRDSKSFFRTREKFIFDIFTTKDHFVNYEYLDIVNFKIPFELDYIKESFIKSEYILNLDEDWDDNNSPAYNVEIWKKALNFIYSYSTKLFSDFNKKIEVPKIYHGPNGSIDILIENDQYSLLINIPNDADYGVYFGKDSFGNNIKGEINLSKLNYSIIPIAFNF